MHSLLPAVQLSATTCIFVAVLLTNPAIDFKPGFGRLDSATSTHCNLKNCLENSRIPLHILTEVQQIASSRPNALIGLLCIAPVSFIPEGFGWQHFGRRPRRI